MSPLQKDACIHANMAAPKPSILHFDSPSLQTRRRCGLTKRINTASLHGDHLKTSYNVVDIYKPPESSSDESTGSTRRSSKSPHIIKIVSPKQTRTHHESGPSVAKPLHKPSPKRELQKRNLEYSNDLEDFSSRDKARNKYGSRKRVKITSNIHTDPTSPPPNLQQDSTAHIQTIVSNNKPKFNLPPKRECKLAHWCSRVFTYLHPQHQASQ